MDFQRLLLYVAAMFLGLTLWQTWMKDYAPKPTDSVETESKANDSPSQPADPRAKGVDVPDLPQTMDAPTTVAEPDRRGAVIDVRTDLIEARIDTRGGVIRSLRLLRYPVTKDRPDQPFELLHEHGVKTFIVQTGLLASAGEGVDHHTLYQASAPAFEMQEGKDSLSVTLSAELKNGVRVEKVFRFTRNSYLIDIVHRLTNGSGEPWTGRMYSQLQKNEPTDDEKSAFIHTYDGAAIYSHEEKYEKLKYKDLVESPLSRVIHAGWAAFIQHYFVAALIPDKEADHHYYGKRLSNGRYVIGMISPGATASANGTAEFSVRAFIGPKEQDRMAKASEGLEYSVDYGYLSFIADLLFIAMTYIHKLIPNWGWTIILLTVLVKLAFFKLSETSYRSMARMRKLTPKLQSMKERYGDDKQRMQQAMMDLYKKEKVNPLGGCWPMLVQIPVFISLYWVLLESVEMRQAPWILWIDDLSTKDPYFVLPLIMGVSMFIQQKLNPTPPDPMQAKIMMSLPFIFTVFFAFFPSGLVLYWVVNNILSISQQYVITRRIEAEGK